MAKKILVVDDSKTLELLLVTLLRRQGYQVITVDDGEEAVRKVASEAPSLVLTDIMMPKMDGLQTLIALRAQPATHGIPVIMVTTKGEQANVQAAVRNGCNDFITKPVDIMELITKVKRCTGPA